MTLIRNIAIILLKIRSYDIDTIDGAIKYLNKQILYTMNSSEKYLSVVDDLQYTKRELANLRIKYNTMETDYNIIKSNFITQQNTTEQLQQQNDKLKCENISLQRQKQNLIETYKRDIENIKTEMLQKQQEIHEERLRNQQCMTNLGSKLMRKQIELEIENRVQEEIEEKNQKIEGLKAQLEKKTRENLLEREKYEYKIKQAEERVEECEERYLADLKNQANKVYAESHKKIFNSEQSMLRQLRRQINDLRGIIFQKDEQIENLIDEKNKLYSQRNEQSDKFQKQTNKLHEQLRLAKLQYENKTNEEMTTMKTILDREKSQKKIANNIQNNQIRKLRSLVDDLECECSNKERLIKDLKIEKEEYEEQLENRNRKLKSIKDEHMEEIKNMERRIKQSHQELQDTFQGNTEITNIKNIRKKNIMNQQTVQQNNVHRNVENVNNQYRFTDKRQTVQNNMINNKRISDQCMISDNRMTNDNRISDQRMTNDNLMISDLKIQMKQQQEKHLQTLDILEKTEKKYQKAKQKLEEANQKVLQLIREKMTMAINSNPRHQKPTIGKNDPEDLNETDYRHGHEYTNRHKQHDKRNQFLSPQQHQFHKTENSQFYRSSKYKDIISRSNNREFYERSLSITKNRKNLLNNFECLNHGNSNDQQFQEHQHHHHECIDQNYGHPQHQ